MSPDSPMLVQIVWKHFVLVVGLFVFGWLIRNRSAAFRHRFWVIGFLWIAVLPALELKLPSFSYEQVRGVEFVQPPIEYFRPPTLSLTETTSRMHGAVSAAESPGKADVGRPITGPAPTPGVPWNPVPAILAVYAAGLALGLLRFSLSVHALGRIVRSGSQPESSDIAALERVARVMGLRRTPRLIVNDEATVPMTFWLGRSFVVIPARSVSEAVLLHECAHIRRGDWFAQALARLVRAVFWFDPILIFAERQMRAASEVAADDCAILAGAEPLAFAQELVALAARPGSSALRAGVAVVGSSDLKARIARLVRSGPRIVHVPFRWFAATVLVGALAVVPFAALKYSQTSLPAAQDGLISFGNGYWIKLFAVTQIRNGVAVSWNMRGERLPRAVGPVDELTVRSDPTKPKQLLVFATNLDSSDGLIVRGVGFDAVRPDGIDTWTYAPDAIEPMSLWSVMFVPPGGTRASLRITTPVEPYRTVIAHAHYENDRLTRSSGPELFPSRIYPKIATQIPIPSGLVGRVELEEWWSGLQGRPLSTSEDPALGALPFEDFEDAHRGHLTDLVMKSRGEPKEFLISNIPTRPETDQVEAASPPAGVEFQQAVGGNYKFSDGETLSLKSIGYDKGARYMTMLGLPLKSKAHFSPDVWEDDNPPNSTHESFNPRFFFTGRQPQETTRALSFTQTEPPSKVAWVDRPHFAVQAISLFDAAGLRADERRLVTAEPELWEDTLIIPESADAKPQDFIVRIADPTHPESTRIPIGEAFSRISMTPTKAKWEPPEIHTIDVHAARTQSLKDRDADTRFSVRTYLVDSHGKRVDATTFTSDGDLDTYTIPVSAGRKFVAVDVERMPYLYIRFANVHVNP